MESESAMIDAEEIQVVLERQDEVSDCETGHCATPNCRRINVYSSDRQSEIF
jgi:hypothetical protein